MKLITNAIQKKLDAGEYYGETPICKFFNPCGAGTWIVFGQDKENPDLLFCVVDLGMDCVEAGSVSLSELQNTKVGFGLGIERDILFEADGRNIKDFLSLETLQGC